MTHHINKLKNTHHMITLKDEEKYFDKIQHPFMLKTAQKVGIEGICINISIIKAIHDKPIFKSEKLKAFPLRSRISQSIPTLTTFIQYSFGNPSHGNVKKKEIQIGKKEAKLSLFADDMIVVTQLPSHVQLFATPWTAACQDSLSIFNSWSLHKLMSIESVILFSHLII